MAGEQGRERETPYLDMILPKVNALFRRSEVIRENGEEVPCTAYRAARCFFWQTGADPEVFARQLIRETIIKPMPMEGNAYGWQEFWTDLACKIVSGELKLRYLDDERIEKERICKYLKLHQPDFC